MSESLREIIVGVAIFLICIALTGIGRFIRRKWRKELEYQPSNKARKLDFYSFLLSGIGFLLLAVINPAEGGIVPKISLSVAGVVAFYLPALQFRFFYKRVEAYEDEKRNSPADSGFDDMGN